MSFVAGYNLGVTWTPDTGGGASLCVTGWSPSDGGDLVDVTNTCTNAHQAFIAAIKRTSVNVTAFVNSAVVPSSVNIKFGVKGIIALQFGTSTSYSIHCIIEKVNYQSTVNGALQYNFDVKSDALNADGSYNTSPITYPG